MPYLTYNVPTCTVLKAFFGDNLVTETQGKECPASITGRRGEHGQGRIHP